MSSGGTLTATVVPATPTPPVRRKVVTENWDDDFEFSLPVKPKRSPAPGPALKGLALASCSRDNGFPRPLDSSDSLDEDWDDPGPSRSATGFASTSSSAFPSRPNSHKRPAALLQLPRSSPSQSPTLPSAPARRMPLTLNSSSSSNLRADLSASPARTLSKRSSTSFTKSDSGDLSLHGASPAHKSSPNLADSHRGTGRLRRTSMLPLRPQSPTKGVLKSPAKSLAKELHTSPSSEQLKKPKFWKRLSGAATSTSTNIDVTLDDAPPVPPLPPNMRTPSVGSSSAISAMSSSPSSTSKSPVHRLTAMLRRSSSNLSAALKHSTPSPPPLPHPPHPYALRTGQESSTSVYASRSTRESSPAVYALRQAQESSPSMHAMRHAHEGPSPMYAMRAAQESSASMYAMRHAQESSASIYAMRNGHGSVASVVSPMGASTSSVNVTMGAAPSKVFGGGLHHSASRQSLVPSTASASGATTPRRPSPIKVAQSDVPAPRTFSPGFHLPNTAAGSPYRVMAQQLSPVASTSRSGPTGSDTETEENGSTTPRRRRRVRPVSVQPPPREISNARFREVNASVPVLGTDQHQRPEPVRIPSSSILSQSVVPHTDPTSPATSLSQTSMSSNGFGHTTLKRITSFSKKHGRRLSGGWKFGSTSSTSSIESEIAVIQQAQVVHRLEPVAGSPSKLPTMDKGVPSALSASSASSIDIGSPTTVEHPPGAPVTVPPAAPAQVAVPLPEAKVTLSPSAKPQASPVKAKAKNVEAEVWDDWDEPTTTARKRPRERRRMSFGDFVIPDSVLAKQKELKRGIGAVKKFAGGVEALKSLIESHDRVCDYILANGSQSETRLFAALEDEYAQWWEMATVLIEVGSTRTDGASASAVPNPRRVTLATEDARVAGEALRQVSGASMSSFASTASGESRDVFLVTSNGPPRASPPPEFGRASTGRHDLSKRQLEVLRTMLRTPVDRSESVVPSVDQRHATTMTARRAKHMSMPAVPVSAAPPPLPTPPRTLVAPRGAHGTPSPEGTYIFPSPGYPSPNTAAVLAQPKKTGLAGLREFLRGLKKSNTPSTGTPTKAPRGKPPRRRPAPINLLAAEKYTSPPASPPITSGPSDEFHTQRSAASGGLSPRKEFTTTPKRRRPSLRNMFRPGSGNWSDLVRATPPTSPFVGENGSQPSLRDSAPPTPARLSPENGRPTHALQRPPSIPALTRLKSNSKPYGVGVNVDDGSTRRRGSVQNGGTVFPAQPSTPTLGDAAVVPSPPPADSDATLRLKNRVRGLGHPSECSPSRATSSPARASEMLPPVGDETPRCRSDHGPRGPDVIALTPENLPVLLDYVQQCERRLDEWRRRADRLGVNG
ncbi:hypothetical protein CC85DRAFT_301868 [Cutaneotrichosporon oleaginosum]|uniref:Uncharacterized protein n=1 Tax=Cutaneotrichosporon oleaginosum TaxID=879819 RepID=A0A0J1B5E7_9TREE|nr:uncharacterized protein CC85DRAFT_301868 [Cutaneotrichosporon oleaginosum]KLT42899.1 hypothetical protein CC85DRAFT_301868 [Cutaneotrichosporon oleaginosum]TXT12603.1 hypothetical protein COLE_03013 [Cutaneotrichosporon oleaginosum]